MKKLIITLLAAVLASGAFAQSSFPDIPANHWAGDAVDRIADLGIVIGFPDGTFRGNEAFTRYQAALVVSRMLDVINDNVNSALALTQADVDSLRNAVQELASDVAAQGVRLSAAESAIAGLSDDVTANTSRLDDLEAALASMPSGMDPQVLRDLQNQIASQRVALDTAQAQADAAAARADAAYSLANQANTLGRQNADDIAAVNRVIQLLQADVTALKSAPAPSAPAAAAPVDLAGVNSAIERNRSDIANIREFVILLRSSQVALRDRVSALEASDAAQNNAIADLQDRVTALEENPLGISGSITAKYYVGRTIGEEFDVDRAYGLNAMRHNMGASVFSTGAKDLDGNKKPTSPGEVAQDRQDITQQTGDVTATLSLSFATTFGFDGEGSPNKLNNFSGVLDISIGNQSMTSYPTALNWFTVNEFMTTFEPIGAYPLTFTFGTNVETSFTPYVVATDEPGFVATVGAPDFMAFLNPGITAVYTTPDQNDDYLRGLRLTVNPLEGLTLGGSFAQYAENAYDKDDYLANNDQVTVWGVDGNLALSIFDLGFEWANGSGTGAHTAESVLYATLDVDTAGLPILSSLGANYRNISDAWTSNGYNLGAAAGDFPFAEDQSGFGVNAGLGLWVVNLDAYFDSYSTRAGDSAMSFGVDASADLFAGFSLGGWYHQAAVNGTTVDDLATYEDASETQVVLAGLDIERDNNYNTGFGVTLSHDGAAPNALISGLNIDAGYSQTEADFSKTTLFVDADYTLNVSIVSLTPYVGYKMVNDADAGTDDTTTLKVGAGLSTTPLDVYTKPSLLGTVNYRTTSHADLAVFTASELQWSVGLVLNEFIFDHSVLTAKYGSWTGTNVSNVQDSFGVGDTATQISRGDADGTGTQSVSGYEFIWDYYDLQFAYGVYTNDNAGTLSSAQAFQITYKVTF
ncbi:MAG: S-layer homology domain-containing protein [Truepera sp.]|jgi:uncharacterized coiled-coil protein SlyX|nr:S-layer homology domain-containing protein [Truepera sp.]